MSKEQKTDLRDFIKDNYQLLTAMGVFGGLTTLFTRLENASYLSFLSFLMFIVLGIELCRKFPFISKATFTLYVFENLTLTLLFMVTVYILIYYYGEFLTYLPQLIVVLVIFFGVTSLRKTLEYLRKSIQNAKQNKRQTLISIGIVILVASSLIIIVYLISYWFVITSR
jgi:hypothetical protein